MPLPNVSTLPAGGTWQNCLEGAYLESFFENLESYLSQRFKDFHFHILHHNLATAQLDLPHFGKNHILLWLSDESSQLPQDIHKKFGLILKSYHLPPAAPANIHPFPLCGSSSVFRFEPVHFNARKTTVFFSGNLNKNRAELFYTLKFPWLEAFTFPSSGILLGTLSTLAKKMPWGTNLSHSILGSFLNFTKSFRSGLPEHDYAARLSDARICICPKGFMTAETIRHFEAMRLGCVVLSASLPPSPFYQGSPILEFTSWRHLKTSIHTLLSDPSRLEEISRSTFAWWESKTSPRAIAIQAAEFLRSI